MPPGAGEQPSLAYFGDRSMTIGVSEPNVLLDLTAGALRTVAEAIVGALYVLAELAAGVLALRKLDVVPLRNSSLSGIGSVRK